MARAEAGIDPSVARGVQRGEIGVEWEERG